MVSGPQPELAHVPPPRPPLHRPDPRIVSTIVLSRSLARHQHVQVVPKPHPLVTSLLLALTREELEVATERVRLYGQIDVIEILDGAIVAGLVEYQACVAAGVRPELTVIEAPDELIEHVIRRNIPRHLSRLDRACVAVLAQDAHKAITHERKREGGRAGGFRAGKLRAEDARSCFEGERWTHAAARVVGTTEGAVRRLAHIYKIASDVFAAVRARRIEILRDARDLAQNLKDPEARSEVIALRAADPRAPVARLIADVTRARRPELPATTGAGLRGERWTLYAGRRETKATKVPSGSIDLVHADVEYGDVPMVSEVARVAARVLAPGGVLAILAGAYEPLAILSAVAAEGLKPLVIGSLALQGVKFARPGRTDRVERIDALPVYFFAKGTRLAQPIAHVAFVSERKTRPITDGKRTSPPRSTSSGRSSARVRA
jgi:hypothetical protein